MSTETVHLLVFVIALGLIFFVVERMKNMFIDTFKTTADRIAFENRGIGITSPDVQSAIEENRRFMLESAAVTPEEKAAMQGTYGTPGEDNRFVTESDPVLTRARAREYVLQGVKHFEEGEPLDINEGELIDGLYLELQNHEIVTISEVSVHLSDDTLSFQVYAAYDTYTVYDEFLHHANDLNFVIGDGSSAPYLNLKVLVFPPDQEYTAGQKTFVNWFVRLHVTDAN